MRKLTDEDIKDLLSHSIDSYRFALKHGIHSLPNGWWAGDVNNGTIICTNQHHVYLTDHRVQQIRYENNQVTVVVNHQDWIYQDDQFIQQDNIPE